MIVEYLVVAGMCARAVLGRAASVPAMQTQQNALPFKAPGAGLFPELTHRSETKPKDLLDERSKQS